MNRKSSLPVKRRKASTKPKKPRPDFPLFPHASGKWAKQIRGKMYYFGKWDDPAGAEDEYLDVADDLHAGRRPREGSRGATVGEMCGGFASSKRRKVDTGNLSPRTFIQYQTTCERLVDEFGKNRVVSDLGPKDFHRLYDRLAEQYSVTSLGSQITQVKMVFKYAYESELIDRVPKYGPDFKAPSKVALRRARATRKLQNGSRTFEAEQIRAMLKEAPPQLKAMILLGINCGLGNTDCASLPLSALDLKRGWLDLPRPKSGVERRIPLWPRTVQALKKVIARRRTPGDPDDENILFLTLFGQRWVRYSLVETTHYGKTEIKPKQDDAIAKATSKLLKKLDIKRPGLSFYSLRHTFETVAGGSADQVAVNAVMGHVDDSMADVYRHGIDEKRLRAVVEHVHDWLFPKPKQKSKK